VLMNLAADDPESQRRMTAFVQGLQQLGWTDGRNVRIDHRWGAGDAERARRYAAELVALGPDVILASGDHSVVASRQASRTVPIVFTLVADPVGTGYVDSLARPGGNMSSRPSAAFWGASCRPLASLPPLALPRLRRDSIERQAIAFDANVLEEPFEHPNGPEEP